MNKIKYALAAGGLSAALMLGMAAPVAAQPQETGPGDNNVDNSVTVEVDNSRNVNGDCSAIMEQDVDQAANTDQTNVGVNEGENTGGLQALVDQEQTNNQSNNQSNSSETNQSATQSFDADCSVTHVHEAAQVEAPEGGVEAGAGGAAGSALGSLLGLGGSAGSLGYGILRLRKRA